MSKVKKNMRKNSFDTSEKKLIGGISLVLAMRMLGINLIIPILSIYASEIEDGTSALAGIAFGIFGIMQAIFQIPMGRLSDRWGRKQTTLLGLYIFAIGTILSGMALNIYHLIAARMIAGAGAVWSTTMAWLADGIEPQKRNEAFSYVGIFIGASVFLAFVLSPTIGGRIGYSYLFYICAGLIFISIFYISFNMKNRENGDERVNTLNKEIIMQIFRNRDLKRLIITGIVMNTSLGINFFTMPILINRHMPVTSMWIIFAPMAIIGTTFMYFLSREADTRGTVPISMIGLSFILISTFIILVMNNLFAFIISFILFYSGFCILSPVMPAAVSKFPNTQIRGTVMSIFKSFTFLGSSIGGFMSGILLETDHRYLFGILLVLLVCALFAISGYNDFSDKTIAPHTPRRGA